MKRAIIIGATSGIGLEVAKSLLKDGWKLGVAGRREAELEKLQMLALEQISIQKLDVTSENAAENLQQLIEKTGGMDLFFLASGIGKQNPELLPEIELQTAQTNVVGFTRVINAAYQYFKGQGRGHIAVISSIAGTKGLGAAPAYSATKRFQSTYMEALEQLSNIQNLEINFTDIRPGFVATALLSDNKNYPMLMKPENVAKSIVRAIYRKRRVAVIDWRYAVLVAVWRMIPKWLWVRLKVKN
ncbi:MAG: SDR family NAD(P)-dependent oxidoreductase [Prevotellaceae bacterium]|jgi:short-subunit dehydrogenase|nr:SDR family NAD(P)-dependent oxidoreductase [Prevotellaceae bacterium]